MNDALQADPVAATRQGRVPIRLEARSSSGTQCAPACELVIFGAGGDLTKRLLMSSRYDLAGSHLLDRCIEANWAVVDPLLEVWAQGDPQLYPAGSAGPASADARARRVGQWLALGLP